MSIHDHDPEYYRSIRKFATKDEKAQAKKPITKDAPPINNDNDPYDENRLGSYIYVYLRAKNMSLEDFINWCKEQDYYFERPIKTPKFPTK